MTEKLLPCPFCGGEPKLRTHRSGEDSMECYVECPSCEVRTTYYEDAYAPVADARGAWNRRTPPPSSHVLVEDEIARVVQSVNEWDDRTSPDDYPEHLLITSEELSEILRNFADTLGGRNDG